MKQEIGVSPLNIGRVGNSSLFGRVGEQCGRSIPMIQTASSQSEEHRSEGDILADTRRYDDLDAVMPLLGALRSEPESIRSRARAALETLAHQ